MSAGMLLSGEPRVLFTARRSRSSFYTSEYSVAPGDQQFVFHLLNEPAPDRIVVVENVIRTAPR